MWKWIFVFSEVTLKAIKTLVDIVRCLYQTFYFGETLPLNHLLVSPPLSFFTASLVSGSHGCHLVPANAQLPLANYFYADMRADGVHILVHVRVTLFSGSCRNVKYDMRVSGQRTLSICSLVFVPPSPSPEKIILEEVEGHFTSYIANKLTGGPSAPGLPGKPGFPVGP